MREVGSYAAACLSRAASIISVPEITARIRLFSNSVRALPSISEKRTMSAESLFRWSCKFITHSNKQKIIWMLNSTGRRWPVGRANLPYDGDHRSGSKPILVDCKVFSRRMVCSVMEARPGFEPGYQALQTSAYSFRHRANTENAHLLKIRCRALG